jgi:NAD(P)-dependent dehydrogenase (short-subunit alcohol dehydrogenase family)
MLPKPAYEPRFRGADKLKDKVVLVTGGDSGIGRAVAVHMAREGADIAIIYLEEHDDAAETARHVKAEGRHCGNCFPAEIFVRDVSRNRDA